MRKFLSIILLIMFSATVSNAQFLTGQKGKVLLKGVVLDEFTGQPAKVTVQLEAPGGDKIKLQSNSKTGKFEQLLDGGKTYEITFTHYNILRKETKITSKVSDDFIEQKEDFVVKVLREGKNLFSESIFSPGTSSINENGFELLENIAWNMRFNRSVEFFFFVYGKSGLAEQRKEALEKYIKDEMKRYRRRIEVKIGIKPPVSPDDDFVVEVSKMENVFE